MKDRASPLAILELAIAPSTELIASLSTANDIRVRATNATMASVSESSRARSVMPGNRTRSLMPRRRTLLAY